MNALMNLTGAVTLPDWVSASFPTIRLVLMITIAVLSIALVVVILFQPASSSGLGALSGQSDTFYAKNKSKTLEGAMKRLTIILSIAIAVLSLLFFISLAIYSGV